MHFIPYNVFSVLLAHNNHLMVMLCHFVEQFLSISTLCQICIWRIVYFLRFNLLNLMKWEFEWILDSKVNQYRLKETVCLNSIFYLGHSFWEYIHTSCAYPQIVVEIRHLRMTCLAEIYITKRKSKLTVNHTNSSDFYEYLCFIVSWNFKRNWYCPNINTSVDFIFSICWIIGM